MAVEKCMKHEFRQAKFRGLCKSCYCGLARRVKLGLVASWDEAENQGLCGERRRRGPRTSEEVKKMLTIRLNLGDMGRLQNVASGMRLGVTATMRHLIWKANGQMGDRFSFDIFLTPGQQEKLEGQAIAPLVEKWVREYVGNNTGKG